MTPATSNLRNSCRPARRDSNRGFVAHPGLALLRRALALGSTHVAPQGGARETQRGMGSDTLLRSLSYGGQVRHLAGHPASLFELRRDRSGTCHLSLVIRHLSFVIRHLSLVHRVLQRTQKPLQRECLGSDASFTKTPDILLLILSGLNGRFLEIPHLE